MRRTITWAVALAIALATLGLSAPAAAAAPAPQKAETTISFVIPDAVPGAVVPMGYFGNGNYWYTKWVYAGGQLVLTGNIRFSWSHMWYIKTHWNTNAALAAAVCQAVPSTAGKAACTAYAIYVAATVRSKVNAAIYHKKCLTVRFGLPPYPVFAGAAIWEVTCTR